VTRRHLRLAIAVLAILSPVLVLEVDPRGGVGH
jgi:hypothetical protein